MTAKSDTRIPSGVRRLLVILMLVQTVNFLDRQIVNILAQNIKLDLHLSDKELGVITGIAFALLYALLSIPSARLAQRVNRPALLGGAVALWSGFTALCAYAHSFSQLALARVGVGIGESVCTPIAHSLIADYVTLEHRTRAIAIFQFGTPIGGLLGTIIGGVVADLYGWRMAFLIVGLPGLLLAGLVWLFLKEPRDAARAALDLSQTAGESWFKVVKAMFAKRSFRWLLLATLLYGILTSGQNAFIAAFFLRAHAIEMASWGVMLRAATGIAFGPVGILGAIFCITSSMALVGLYVGGRIADKKARTDLGIMLKLPGWAVIVGILPFLLAIFCESAALAFVSLAAYAFATGVAAPAQMTSVLGLVDARNRATAAAVFLVISTLVGLGFGPLLIGILSDYFNNGLGLGPTQGLRWGLGTIYWLAVPSGIAFFLGAKHYRNDFVE